MNESCNYLFKTSFNKFVSQQQVHFFHLYNKTKVEQIGFKCSPNILQFSVVTRVNLIFTVLVCTFTLFSRMFFSVYF